MSHLFAAMHDLDVDVCERALVLTHLLFLMFENDELFHVNPEGKAPNVDHLLSFTPPITAEELEIHLHNFSGNFYAAEWLDIATRTSNLLI